MEYRQARNDPQADIRLKGTLDAAARKSLGLDPGDTIIGSIPMRIVGRVGTNSDREGRFAIDADLTSAKIDGFLPGWVKPAGRPAHVSMTLTTQPQSVRIDDLVIAGAGTATASRVRSTSTVTAICKRRTSSRTDSPTATRRR